MIAFLNWKNVNFLKNQKQPVSFLRQDNKFSIFDGIESEDSFLRLAREFGEPVLLKTGTFIKTLNVIDQDEAPINSLSAKHGTGVFPFHSDTAFWSPPARFVLLRAVKGDLGRPTFVKTFHDLFYGLARLDIVRSAWICDKGTSKNYTTIFFDGGTGQGYRYDPGCMRPANKIGEKIEEIIRPRAFGINGDEIKWEPNRAVAIPNWTHVHARGRSSNPEYARTLQRIYIK